jgi:hypothetical protein
MLTPLPRILRAGALPENSVVRVRQTAIFGRPLHSGESGQVLSARGSQF